jgi:RNA polymerase sigma-70 factor (ECF subfamily)
MMVRSSDYADGTGQRPPTQDACAIAELFAGYRERLRGIVALRLDKRLQGRLDPSDVVQDAYVEATRRFHEYTGQSALSPYLWLRLLTMQQLQLVHRQNLNVQARDARREVAIASATYSEVSSEALALRILDSTSTPSESVARLEAQARLQAALETLDAVDREMLALRHFEQLSNAEAAQLLGLRQGTASQRYYRALGRLRETLDATIHGWEDRGE